MIIIIRFVANSELGFVVTFPAISIGPGFVGVIIIIIVVIIDVVVIIFIVIIIIIVVVCCC